MHSTKEEIFYWLNIGRQGQLVCDLLPRAIGEEYTVDSSFLNPEGLRELLLKGILYMENDQCMLDPFFTVLVNEIS